MPAMRTAYVRAVQRCHELQLHSARTAEAEAALRPELARACERIAALQGEVNALRVAQAARTTRAPAVAIEAPSSAKAAPPAPAATTSSSTTPSGLATLQPGHSRLNATPAAAWKKCMQDAAGRRRCVVLPAQETSCDPGVRERLERWWSIS